MSILLEALRKSEKSQHQPEVPTIHTNDQTEAVSESLKTGPLALLLVVTLFATGWSVWRQYQLPAGDYQPPVMLTGDQVSAKTTTTPEALTDGGVGPGSPSVATDNATRLPRTPVETFKSAAGTQSQASTNNPGSPTDTQRPNSGNKAGVDLSGSEENADDNSNASEQDKYQPQRPAPIGYWELPDAVRADVPEIKFSVLVYATNPADRFVLINGQRLNEGDSTQPGLVIEEIRLDGVVFSYRLYQFLIEK